MRHEREARETEHKQFQEQILAELKRQGDAMEKQNETLNRILER